MPTGEKFKGKKPTNTPKGPSTEAEFEKRVLYVAKLLIQSYARYEIVAIITKEYGVSPDAVDNYIKKAKEQIRAKNDESLKDKIELTEAKIIDLYQGARRDKKRGEASRILKLLMELRGLEAPKKIEVSGGMSIKEEELEKFGDEGLTEEEKKLAREITGLEE